MDEMNDRETSKGTDSRIHYYSMRFKEFCLEIDQRLILEEIKCTY